MARVCKVESLRFTKLTQSMVFHTEGQTLHFLQNQYHWTCIWLLWGRRTCPHFDFEFVEQHEIRQKTDFPHNFPPHSAQCSVEIESKFKTCKYIFSLKLKWKLHSLISYNFLFFCDRTVYIALFKINHILQSILI